tara:strand:+ start:185 stop:319 length:135 start_codon:yes stop_codon:yes gene_type:complete
MKGKWLNIGKIDLRIITWAWMMFMALDLNRRNINRGVFDFARDS